MSQRLILIVDDNESVRIGLRLLLQGEGYSVAEATNGKEALTFLETQLPAAIICDVEMPLMDGYQFRQALLQQQELSLIPFFFLTGHTTVAETLHGLDLEVDDYIPKTITAAVLRKKLDNAIRRHENERRAATVELAKASTASGIQLLPEKPPLVPGFILTQFHRPYRQTPGGDFFDYITLEGKTFVVLGDVMGKQWSAWMFAQAYAGYVRSTIRSLATISPNNVTPAGILTQLNAMLCCDEKVAETLWTLAITQLAHDGKDILYASAAHIPSYLLVHNSDIPKLIDHGAAPIGYSKTTSYTDISFTMDEGDILVMLTDGITEASKESDTDFGEKILAETLAMERQNRDLGRVLYERALVFAGTSELHDDATILVIRKGTHGTLERNEEENHP